MIFKSKVVPVNGSFQVCVNSGEVYTRLRYCSQKKRPRRTKRERKREREREREREESEIQRRARVRDTKRLRES